MKSMIERLGRTLFAVAFAASVVAPATLLAQIDPSQANADEETQATTDETTAAASDTEGAQQPGESQDATTAPVTGLTATIYYVEIISYDDPDHGLTTGTGRLLGTRVISGLTEGQQLHAWDYVRYLPGFFFFDGYPRYLTVSTDESKNVIELDYGNSMNTDFTVNYYLMTGADLTADTWAGALAPEDVTFTKMGSQTFTGRPALQAINGDAFEYKLNDLYVIDTYPSEIVLDPNSDDNTINVLYTSAIDVGPEGVPVPDTPQAPDLSPTPPTDIISPAPPDDAIVGEPEEPAEPEAPLPGDATLTEDEVISLLPEGANADPELIKDFVDNPRTTSGVALTQTGDQNVPLFTALSIVAGAAVAVIAVALFVRRRDTSRNSSNS